MGGSLFLSSLLSTHIIFNTYIIIFNGCERKVSGLKAYNSRRSVWLLLLLVLIGGLIGSLVGALLGGILPVLNMDLNTMGLEPFTIELIVLKITFGIMLKLNLASIIGFILAIIIYVKL